MPFADHIRVTCSGILGNTNIPRVGQDIFSFRVNMSDPGTHNKYNQAGLNDVIADCSAFFSRPSTGIGNQAVLTQVKMGRIGPLGKYREAPLVSGVLNVGGGGAVGSIYPPQVSVAVSLTTDRLGATGRGRFYIPLPVQAMGQDYLLNATNATDLRTSVVTWLNALNNWPDIEAGVPRVVVASSKGYNSNVTGVRVGRAFDTIRTRRNDLQESYTSTAVVV